MLAGATTSYPLALVCFALLGVGHSFVYVCCATAIQLRFDIKNSPTLPANVRARLLDSNDQRISADGIVVIKAQASRSQDRNRQAALRRLAALLKEATRKKKPRIPTRPSKKAKAKRLDAKSRHGELKKSRQRVRDD